MRQASRISLAVRSIACFVGTLTTGISLAEDDISTDRPDFVESSDVVDKGVIQIETGISFERNDRSDPHTRTTTTPTLFRYGLGSGFELRAETDGRIVERAVDSQDDTTEREFSDLSLGVKWHVRDGSSAERRPALAVLLHADLPSGSEHFKGEGVRPSLRGVAEWEFENSLSIGVMPGIVYDQSNEHRFWSGILAVTSSIAITRSMHGFFEVAGQQFAHQADGGNLITVDFGLTYTVRSSVQLDCAISRGINANTPEWTVGAGVSVRL